MTQIELPDIATSKLAGLQGPTAISDTSGHVLGTFIPGVSYNPELYKRNPSPLTPEERQRRRREGGGKPLSQFWEEMKQKYPDEFQ